jgi:hypothetical protein
MLCQNPPITKAAIGTVKIIKTTATTLNVISAGVRNFKIVS